MNASHERKDHKKVNALQLTQHTKTWFRRTEEGLSSCGIQDSSWETIIQSHSELSSFSVFLMTFFFLACSLQFFKFLDNHICSRREWLQNEWWGKSVSFTAYKMQLELCDNILLGSHLQWLTLLFSREAWILPTSCKKELPINFQGDCNLLYSDLRAKRRKKKGKNSHQEMLQPNSSKWTKQEFLLYVFQQTYSLFLNGLLRYAS